MLRFQLFGPFAGFAFWKNKSGMVRGVRLPQGFLKFSIFSFLNSYRSESMEGGGDHEVELVNGSSNKYIIH